VGYSNSATLQSYSAAIAVIWKWQHFELNRVSQNNSSLFKFRYNVALLYHEINWFTQFLWGVGVWGVQYRGGGKNSTTADSKKWNSTEILHYLIWVFKTCTSSHFVSLQVSTLWPSKHEISVNVVYEDPTLTNFYLFKKNTSNFLIQCNVYGKENNIENSVYLSDRATLVLTLYSSSLFPKIMYH
jgi:hypothetical protein